MKWLSPSVARTPKLLIFIPALGLIVLGLLTANSGSSASFSAFFLVFTAGVILLIYWNFFNSNNNSKKITRSNPGVVKERLVENISEPVDINRDSDIPNPLDKDFDIPLM